MRPDPSFEKILARSPVDGIPNNPLLPALVMPGAMTGTSAAEIEARYRQNGWVGTWVYTVFDYHHYHPASHEALTCAQGTARIQIGGATGPVLPFAPGDVLVLPAGMGHLNLGSSRDFAVVGAYPPGQTNPDILAADPTRVETDLSRIQATPLPESDPIFGKSGPVMKIWTPSAAT